ncbi:MAG: T9SS type A sorting domain-containing protein [Microscillaceae bacterium]|nr:T9SS type A sorting domain-containing protein [Microscillaceae bacterium]MDW8459690.1 T9SS type A sorting domain-containing protein [Cytophagales bacterium]
MSFLPALSRQMLIEGDTPRPAIGKFLLKVNHLTKDKEKPTKKRNQLEKQVKRKDLALFTDVLFENEKITVSRVYPNPATTIAIIDYVLHDQNINAKITISNVLGNVIQEFLLYPEQKRIKINTYEYNSGVYFYTLSLEGKAVATKKLIVKGS